MIKSQDDDLYIGVTDNPERRLNEHNSKIGSRFTKQRSNFNIVFLEKHQNLKEARIREIQIKKWSRIKKEMLIDRFRSGLTTKTVQRL